MIQIATVQSSRNGKLFRALIEWREDLKCFELLTYEKEIGQRFVLKRAVTDIANAPMYNLELT